jgi:hypothetical protein
MTGQRVGKKSQPTTSLAPDSERGSPITIDGFMYYLLIWVKQRFRNADALIFLDLESEQWKADMIKGTFF